MNTSKLADISEIVSSIAILATLVFLTIQMQQNTEALRASQRQITMATDIQYLYKEVDNPELVLARTKSDLTDEEKIQVYSMLAIYLRMRELDWVQYQNGALDKPTWMSYQNTIIGTLSYSNNRAMWQIISPLLLNRGFVAQINELIAGSPVTDQPEALTLFD